MNTESIPSYSVAACDDQYEYLVTTTNTLSIREGKKVNVKSVKKRKVGIGKAQGMITELLKVVNEVDDKENIMSNIMGNDLNSTVQNSKEALKVPSLSSTKKAVSLIKEPKAGSPKKQKEEAASLKKPTIAKTPNNISQEEIKQHDKHTSASQYVHIKPVIPAVSTQIELFTRKYDFSKLQDFDTKPTPPLAQYNLCSKYLDTQRAIWTALISIYSVAHLQQTPLTQCAELAMQYQRRQQKTQVDTGQVFFLEQCKVKKNVPIANTRAISIYTSPAQITNTQTRVKHYIFEKQPQLQSFFSHNWPCCVPFTPVHVYNHHKGQLFTTAKALVDTSSQLWKDIHLELTSLQQSPILQVYEFPSHYTEFYFTVHGHTGGTKHTKEEQLAKLKNTSSILLPSPITVHLEPTHTSATEAWLHTLQSPVSTPTNPMNSLDRIKHDIQYNGSKLSKTIPTDTDITRIEDSYNAFQTWKSKGQDVLEELLESGLYDEQITSLMKLDSKLHSKLDALAQVLHIDNKFLHNVV